MDVLIAVLIAGAVGYLVGAEEKKLGGLAVAAYVLGALAAVGLWAVHLKHGEAGGGVLADAVLGWIGTLDSPTEIVALVAALLALPLAPEVVRQVGRGLDRLTGFEAGGVKLALAGPTGGAEGAALDAGDGELWVPVGEAWERLAPLQEGEVNAGAPPEPQWARFQGGFAAEVARARQAAGAVGTDPARIEAAAKDAYAALNDWMEVHESPAHPDGWTGEYAAHLAQTADALDGLAIDRPRRLGDDLARAVIFRRGMLLDAAVRSGASGADVGKAARDLFASAARTDRESLKTFARHPRTAAVLALLLHHGRPEDLDAIAAGATRDELEGVARVAREAAAWLRSRKAPEGPASTAHGEHLWALQELLRARAWGDGQHTAFRDAHAAAHAIALLRGLPVDAPHPGPTFRRSAARIAARCGGLPGDDGSGLLALAPELLSDPAGLNDVAVLAARASRPRAAAILARAAALAPTGSPLAAAIAANQKKLGGG